MRPRQCVITFDEPGLGREVKAGKFVWIQVTKRPKRGYWAYVNNVSVQWDLMQELDAWGIAPCVLQAMQEMGIDQIHFCCKEEKATYITDVATVKRFGILRKYGNRGTHWHLPRRYWNRPHGGLEYPWVNKEWHLKWLEPVKAQAEQMEMAL